MKTLVVADDRTVVGALCGAVREAGSDPVAVSDGPSAWVTLCRDPTIRVVVFDGAPPDIDALSLCRRIREELEGPYRYCVMLTQRPHRGELLDALSAGMDEVIQRPLSVGTLAMRLAAVERMMIHRDGGRLNTTMERASREGNGELVVKSSTHVGRVFFHEGRVAWVQIEGHQIDLGMILPRVSEPDSRVEQVLEVCRATGRAFDEVIVSMGFASPDELRWGLLRWFREQLQQLGESTHQNVLFLPGVRPFGGKQTFSISELWPDSDLPQPVPSNRTSLTVLQPILTMPPARACIADRGSCVGCGADVHRTLDAVGRINGILTVAVVNAATGDLIGHRGEPAESEFIRAAVRLMRAGGPGEDLESLVASGRRTQTIISTTACPDAYVLVTARRDVPLGALRLGVREAAVGIAPRPSA